MIHFKTFGTQNGQSVTSLQKKDFTAVLRSTWLTPNHIDHWWVFKSNFLYNPGQNTPHFTPILVLDLQAAQPAPSLHITLENLHVAVDKQEPDEVQAAGLHGSAEQSLLHIVEVKILESVLALLKQAEQLNVQSPRALDMINTLFKLDNREKTPGLLRTQITFNQLFTPSPP